MQVLKLAERDIKTVIIPVFHSSKNIRLGKYKKDLNKTFRNKQTKIQYTTLKYSGWY